MNGPFAEFSDVLKEAVSSRDVLQSEKALRLSRVAKEHAGDFTNGTTGRNNIVCVHIYHDAYSFKDYDVAEYGKYTERKAVGVMENLMRNANPEVFSKILFDDFILYAYKGYKLVEEGCIDDVIFTKKSEGTPVQKSDLIGFSKSKRNYIGGCYGDECVLTAAENIRDYAPFFSITKPISDGIINYNSGLFFPISSISSEQLLKM